MAHRHHQEIIRPPPSEALPSASNGGTGKPPHASLVSLPDLLSLAHEVVRRTTTKDGTNQLPQSFP
jgi:hypothetical protein